MLKRVCFAMASASDEPSSISGDDEPEGDAGWLSFCFSKVSMEFFKTVILALFKVTLASTCFNLSEFLSTLRATV